MERYDARKETYEEIEIFDTLALFLREEFKRIVFQKVFIVMKFGMMMSVWQFHVN